jgi:MFS family permease
MLISNSTSPPYELPERISLSELFLLSPMGLTGSFLNGISQKVLYVSLALYGSAIGLASGSIGILIGCMALGGMLFQFPIGKLSDHVDRRLVIVGAPALAVPVCLILIAMSNPADQFPLLCGLVVALGGLTLPIYSLCMAHMYDHLKPEQVIAASGTLALILAAGMTLGPTLGDFAIGILGPSGIFYLLATTAVLTVATALFRLWHGQPRSENPVATVVDYRQPIPRIGSALSRYFERSERELKIADRPTLQKRWC